MASMEVGLKTPGPELERMLNMTGGYRKPNEALEKLDFLESISGKVMESIGGGKQMKLSLDYLIRFLKRENMTPENDAKAAVGQLLELVARERRRLGKHVTATQEKVAKEFAIVLFKKNSQEVRDVFGLDEPTPPLASDDQATSAVAIAARPASTAPVVDGQVASAVAIAARTASTASTVVAPEAEPAVAGTAAAEGPAGGGLAAKRSPKRKAEDAVAPPAKKGGGKGGFKGMDCPFSKSDFLAHAKDTTMELELQPKMWKDGGYGYQKGGGIAKIEADGPDSQALDDKIAYVRPSCLANAIGSKTGASNFSAAEFMAKAKPLKVTFQISPCEFSTGSFGWMAHRKQTVQVGDKTVALQVNFNAPINKSKEKGDDEPEDPVTAGIDAGAITQHLATIGKATARQKDDLTKIRGIGPWIEKRLNKIQIFAFQQLAKMSPQIEDDVNAAIKYFPGRVRRDEWVLQAQKIVGGKWDELNPLVGKATGTVQIDGKKYEKKLIDIANHAMADGVIEHHEAEALWFCASDGGKITESERNTLMYILNGSTTTSSGAAKKKFNVDDDAKDYLESKLINLDDRGVMIIKDGSRL